MKNNIYKKLADGSKNINICKQISKEELKEYFDSRIKTYKLLVEDNYDLEIISNEDNNSVINYNFKNHKFTLNTMALCKKYMNSINNIFDLNIILLRHINFIIAKIELNRDLENGIMHLVEPEAYVCFVNEEIMPEKKDMLTNNYCFLKSLYYTEQVLEKACREYNMNPMIHMLFTNQSNEYIMNNFLENKRHSFLSKAIRKDNTPSSLIVNFKKLKRIDNNCSKNIITKYTIAIDKFIEREYLRHDISDNSSLFNKLLFGKDLTEKEKDEISSCTNISILNYAYHKHENNVNSLIRK